MRAGKGEREVLFFVLFSSITIILMTITVNYYYHCCCYYCYYFCYYILGRIQSIFWNVCQFYKQFLPNVQEFLTKSRMPIEKELKV